MMKELWAIVRKDKLKKTKDVLDSIGLGSLSVHPCSGRGKQGGVIPMPDAVDGIPAHYYTSAPHLVPTPSYLATEGGQLTKPVTYLPKAAITMVIPSEMVQEAIDAIISVNRTGHAGDGKVFILPVEEAYRIRTGEKGIASVA